jgi:tetratricopeptide (TPR) repeat protein
VRYNEPVRASRAIPRTTSVVLALVLLGAGAPTASASRQQMWAWVLRAAGQASEGQLTAAVASLARARAAHAAPEIDALVGLMALAGGETQPARRQLAAAIRKGTTEPLVFYWAGRAAFAAGDRAAALKRLEEGLAIAGDAPALRMAHALVLLASGNRAAAATSLAAVAAHQPNLLAPSLYPTPKEGVVDLLGAVLRDFPSKAQLRRTQGHLLWKAGRILPACRHFQVVLDKLSAADPDALAMMARCKMALGDKTAALELAGRALERAPSSAQALAVRGEILLEQGQAERAVKDLRKAADALPKDSQLLTRLAQACTAAEQPRCAQTFFKHAFRRDRNNAAACFGMALHHQQAKENDQALAAFGRAMALDPGNPRYYRAAASFAHLVGERKKARRWLAEARHAQAVARRFKRTVHRTTQICIRARLLEEQLQTATAPACPATCRRALGRLPRTARTFAELHLVARRQAAIARAESLLPSLRPAQLLNRDPLELHKKERTVGGQAYVLRTFLPCVPPWRFPAPAASNNTQKQ